MSRVDPPPRAPAMDAPQPDMAAGAVTPVPAAAPVPPEAPLAMPAQDFRAAPPPGPLFVPPSREVVLARIIAFGGAALIAALGLQQMLMVFGGRIQPLQWALLVFFTLTFAWVGFSFCSLTAS